MLSIPILLLISTVYAVENPISLSQKTPAIISPHVLPPKMRQNSITRTDRTKEIFWNDRIKEIFQKGNFKVGLKDLSPEGEKFLLRVAVDNNEVDLVNELLKSENIIKDIDFVLDFLIKRPLWSKINQETKKILFARAPNDDKIRFIYEAVYEKDIELAATFFEEYTKAVLKIEKLDEDVIPQLTSLLAQFSVEKSMILGFGFIMARPLQNSIRNPQKSADDFSYVFHNWVRNIFKIAAMQEDGADLDFLANNYQSYINTGNHHLDGFMIPMSMENQRIWNALGSDSIKQIFDKVINVPGISESKQIAIMESIVKFGNEKSVKALLPYEVFEKNFDRLKDLAYSLSKLTTISIFEASDVLDLDKINQMSFGRDSTFYRDLFLKCINQENPVKVAQFFQKDNLPSGNINNFMFSTYPSKLRKLIAEDPNSVQKAAYFYYVMPKIREQGPLSLPYFGGDFSTFLLSHLSDKDISKIYNYAVTDNSPQMLYLIPVLYSDIVAMGRENLVRSSTQYFLDYMTSGLPKRLGSDFKSQKTAFLFSWNAHIKRAKSQKIIDIIRLQVSSFICLKDDPFLEKDMDNYSLEDIKAALHAAYRGQQFYGKDDDDDSQGLRKTIIGKLTHIISNKNRQN